MTPHEHAQAAEDLLAHLDDLGNPEIAVRAAQAHATLATVPTPDPFISARLLFDPALSVVCLCGNLMAATRPAERDNGPLRGEHGRNVSEHHCGTCNAQVDISIDA